MVDRGRSPSLAKLSRPRLARVLARERLFQRLDECLKHRAVWVTGPAGAGKTTLVVSYVKTRTLPALWYQVDGGDTDPAACCHYLKVAASRIAPRLAREIPALAAAQTPAMAWFFRHFFRTLYAAIGGERFLVMDNAQEALCAATFREFLLFAMHEAPDDLRLIIISRSLPPGDFARLRANEDLAVLDAEELLFTEAESLAVQKLSPSASAVRTVEQMRKLHQVTRGWAAGLKLLLQVDHPDAICASSGKVAGATSLFDYLAAEVFDRQSGHVRNFLLQVAHLPGMTAAMADALCGSDAAARILDGMHRDNLFSVARAVGSETHYEFHPLLRHFLLQRARSDLPAEDLARVIRQAATLLAESGRLDAAAQVLASGCLWADLERLVIEQAQSLVTRGWQRTLSAWLEALPEDRVEGDPWLCYWQGAALAPYDPPAGQARLQSAYRLFRERLLGDGCFLAWSAIVDLICLEWGDFSKLDHWIDEADLLQSEFGPPAENLRERFAGSIFSALLFRRPQDPAIHLWAERLLSMIEHCPDPHDRILLGCNLVLHYNVATGQNAQLDRLMAAIDPPAGIALTPLVEALFWGLKAMQHWSHGQLAQAATDAENGSRLACANSLRMWDFLLGALQVYAWLNSGDLGRGRAALARLAKSLDPRRKIDVAHYHYLVCLASLLAEDGAQALKEIETANAIALVHGGPLQHALGSLAQAQALHALGRTDEAWPFLVRGREIGFSMRGKLICFQADLCEAAFALDEGNHDRCAKALHSAFATGAAENYVNHNTFRPAVVARLCAFALAHGIEPDYTRRLIRIRDLKPPSLEADGWPWAIKVYTLGRFSLVVDDQPVTETGRRQHKPIELLQALIALGGREIAIPRLIESLWPDAESRGGRGAFDVSLSRLRHLLGHDDVLHLESGRVTLNPALCWVDVWAFERLLNQTRAALDGNQPLDVAVLVEQTGALLRLYQGDFLGREECHPWTLPPRERLRTRLANTLADVGRSLEAGPHWGKAVRLYQRAIEIEPLAEHWYRRLMICLKEQGEMAEALRIYVRCCEALWVGLRATPSQETQAIHESLDRVSGPKLQ